LVTVHKQTLGNIVLIAEDAEINEVVTRTTVTVKNPTHYRTCTGTWVTKSIIDVVQKQVSLQNKTVVHHVLNMAKEDTVHSRIRLPVRVCLVKELSIHRWSNATVYNLLFSLLTLSILSLFFSHVETVFFVLFDSEFLNNLLTVLVVRSVYSSVCGSQTCNTVGHNNVSASKCRQ